MNWRPWLPVVMVLAAGCSTPRGGGYYQDDGPHARPAVDVSKIPDAVPRDEPLSERGNNPYTVFSVNYRPLKSAKGYRERGVASWYGKKFHGRRTSSGEPYDMYAMTAAHKTLPLPSYARVRNLNNGKAVVVRVNDRGPFLNNRLIDLSYAAAARLGIIGTGTGVVEVETLSSDEPANVVTARAPETPPLPVSVAPQLYLQVGAFTSRDNAESMKQRLAQADLAPIQIQNSTLDSTPLYRVRIGPFSSVDESDRLAARVAAHGLPNPIVVVE